MGLLNLENTKAPTRYIKGGFRGCYIGLRANFDENLKPWFSIKIGKGTGKKGALGRCDDQALPALFLFDGYYIGIKPKPSEASGSFLTLTARHIVNLERDLIERAREKFGDAPTLYSYAGSCETFGKFETPQEAYQAGKILADRIAGLDAKSDFTKEKLKIVNYFKKTLANLG